VIPAPFEYERPATLADALRALAEGGPATRAIAGGQSLLPLMKLRLARPERLVDIGRLDELRGVRRQPDGDLVIGALTTWADLLSDADVMAVGALADAIPTIGDVQVRNRGTIGGSLAHADPAADIAAPLLALGASVIARSIAGERTIPMAEFFVGPFATALGAAEIVTGVRLDASAARSGSAYVAVPHPASGYPIAGAAVAVAGPEPASGRREDCSVALTGVGETPYRANAVEAAIHRGASLAAAATEAGAGGRVLSDPYADREYRSAMAVVVTRRALAAAFLRAGVTPA
jgi:aerobic carbon-monoxide dehydrogenase medium subunit